MTSDRSTSFSRAAAHDLTARFGEGHWSRVRSLEMQPKYARNGVLLVDMNGVPLAYFERTRVDVDNSPGARGA